MQTSGRICKAEITSNLVPGITDANYYTTINGNAVTDKSFNDPNGYATNYCNQFTSESSFYYKVAPIDSNVNVPRTNVDNFLQVLSKTQFENDTDLRNAAGLNINGVYSYENLLKAVAKFPAFCSINGTILDCKQQVAGFLSITKTLTIPDAGGQALNKVEETCTAVNKGT